MRRSGLRAAAVLGLVALSSAGPPTTAAGTLSGARAHLGQASGGSSESQDDATQSVAFQARLIALEASAAPDPQATWALANDVLDGILANARMDVEGLEAWSRARGLMFRVGFKEHAANLDQVLASELLIANRSPEAEAQLGVALVEYAGHAPALALLHATRADLHRVTADWTAALADLDRADEELAELADLDWLGLIAATRALGVRVQVETFLGRLDRAWILSERELDVARRHLAEHPAIAADALAAARYRSLDLRLSVGSYGSIVQETERLLAGDQGARDDPEQLRMFRALALAGEALQSSRGFDAAAAEVRAVLAGARASGVERLNLLIALGRLQLHGERWDLLAETLSVARAILDQGGGERIVPAREAARILAMEAALARRTGASATALEHAFASLEVAIQAMLARWDAVPALPGGVGYLHDEGRRVLIGECLELGLAMGAEERAFEAVLALQARGALTSRSAAKHVDLATLRRGPFARGGALVFVPTLTTTYLVVVDRDVLQVHRLGPERALRESVRAVRIERLLGRSAQAELAGLAAALLPPATHARIATWEHAFISGAELLEEPPFEALPFGDGRLGELVGLGYAPALPDLAASSPSAPRAAVPGSFALWAFPRVTPDARARWPELVPFGASESAVRWLVGQHSDQGVREHSGSEATRAAFLGQDFAGVRVLNVLAHGVFADERAVPAGLALGAAEGDGIVWAADLVELELPELVVFAVCGGARGPARFGQDGVQHLGGAALAGGARAVLLARGAVAVGPTLEALGHFERGLERGLSPMAALRAARAAFAAEHGSAAALEPFFIMGAGHAPLFPVPPAERGGPPRWAWALAGLLVLGLLARRVRLNSRS